MNKKHIAIVFTNDVNNQLQNDLTNNLYSVFGDLIQVDTVFLNEIDSEEKIIADAILILRPSMISLIENRVDDLSKVVIITRSIPQDSIYEMLNIPKGTNVLVVNDSIETINDTISMFYKLNITHLNFIPYSSNVCDLSNIPVVITPGESRLVPTHIPKVLDIGNRKLDIETFLELFSILEIKDKIVQRNLLNYMDQNVMLSRSVKKRYLKSYIMEESIQQIINVIKSGFIITDYNYNIEFANDIINNIIGMDIISHTHLSSYFNTIDFQKLTRHTKTSILLLLNNLQIMVSVMAIEGVKGITGWCFTFEKATNISSPNNLLTNKFKQEGLIARYTFKDILYTCQKMKKLIEYSKKIAQTDHTVLITGETGTGKEMLAQSIHNESFRKEGPFIAINCAALPESLLESELFGYEDGAFTGAKRGGKIGIFEKATGGTIFLDELCEMSLRVQAKLLRVLQEQQIMRLGGTSLINIDIRVIVATNGQLEEKIKNCEFREDLYYRINAFKIVIPPLRERSEDILLIFKNMVKNYENLSEDIERKLLNHYWKGNIRELKNVADYYTVMGDLNLLDDNRIDKKVIPFEKKEKDLKSEILRIIIKREKQMLVNGRTSLLKDLENENILISHNRLEKSIESLREAGLIIRKKGRAGILSTEEGKKLYLD